MLRHFSFVRTLTTASASLHARAIVARNSLDSHSVNWKLEDVKVSTELKPHDLLIETQAVGICHTDIAFGTTLAGAKILGHEGSGIVKAVGSSVTTAKPGDPVLLSMNYCGACKNCHVRNDPAFCEDFFGYNISNSEKIFTNANDEFIEGKFFGQSTYSSLTVASENSVVNAKDFQLSSDELQTLSPLGCGVQTGAGTIYNIAKPGPGDAVAIYGLGGVGLSAVMASRICGASKIIAIDINEKKLDQAKSFGATHVIKAGDDDEVHAKIMEITGRGTDVAVECIGGSKFIKAAMRSSGVRGKVLFLGVPKDPNDVLEVPILDFMFKAGQLMVATEGGSNPQVFIPKMVEWYKAGDFPVDRMVKKYQLDQFETALDDMKKGLVIKPVLTF